LVSIDGDADLSALATKAELASGLADKLNLDTCLIGQSLPGVLISAGRVGIVGLFIRLLFL
jgi:hypothetical protein